MSAAFARASQAAMSSPDTAIRDIPFMADEMQRADPATISVEWRHRLALRCLGEIFNHRNDVTRGLLEIGLEIAVPDNAFVGVEVDQNQQPISEQAHFRHHGPLQRHNDQPRSNTLQSQLNSCYQWALLEIPQQ